MMKIHMKIWVNLFCFLLVGLKLCGAARLLVENGGLLVVPQNLEAEVACEEAGDTKPWIASANNATKDKANNLLEFRFRENRTGGNAEQESVGLKAQRLSTSQPSPGVGHMQVNRIPKTGERGAKSTIQRERVLESTPSPGVGN
ncbi:hypothetical protein SUGI_0253980 [Cryptomeria japonica]|nr:hypothetical protein SUGI_0253980 [Cryptomeria japonica]